MEVVYIGYHMISVQYLIAPQSPNIQVTQFSSVH